MLGVDLDGGGLGLGLALGLSFLESAIQSTSTLPMHRSEMPERRARSRLLSSALEKMQKPVLRPGISTVAEIPPGEPPPWLARRSPR